MYLDPTGRLLWEDFVSNSGKLGAGYQGSRYFSFLASKERDNEVNLITISDQGAGSILGFIPVRITSATLPWSARARSAGGMKFRSVDILGSEPNMPDDPLAYDNLLQAILAVESKPQLISFEAAPEDSFTWRYISTSAFVRQNFLVYVLHGFRDCHVVHVPPDLEYYYSTLSRKKRYNLRRQERLLEQHLENPLTIHAIETVEDLPKLFAALSELKVPSAHESTLTEADFSAMFSHGIGLCYLMKAGPRLLGLCLGTRLNSVYHIHRFYYDQSLRAYSIGTALWQLIFRDLIGRQSFTLVDMGYGSPNYRHHLTNSVAKRGSVLLIRRSLLNVALVNSYKILSAAKSRLKRRISNILARRR